MRFVPLDDGQEPEGLREDLRTGRRIGPAAVGDRCLFVRRAFTVWWIPWGSVSRCFRRVEQIPVRLGCCMGQVDVEDVVVCSADAGADRERIQIRMPGRRAALALLDEIARHAPCAAVGCLPRAGEAGT